MAVRNQTAKRKKQDELNLATNLFGIMLFYFLLHAVFGIIARLMGRPANYSYIVYFTLFLICAFSLIEIKLIKRDSICRSIVFLYLIFILLPFEWIHRGGSIFPCVTALFVLLHIFTVLEKPCFKWAAVALIIAEAGLIALVPARLAVDMRNTGDMILKCLQMLVLFVLYILSLSMYTGRHKKQVGEMMVTNRKLERLAAVDSLSDVFNRRRILEILDMQNKLARERHSCFYLAMIDMDDLKLINDRFGHMTGDKAIRHTCDYIKRITKAQDYIGRYGGDEFVVVLKSVGDKDIMKFIARLSNIPKLEELMPVSISGGIVRSDGSVTSDQLIHMADIALLQAKQSGKANILLYQDSFQPLNV